MTQPLQLTFYSALWRPLITTDEAAWMLDECSERHVLDLLDEGKLRGVNIAASGETRRLLRIWRYSVTHRLMPKLAKHPLPEVSAEEVITHQRATVLRRELAYWLSCTEQHVSNLGLPGPRDRSETRHLIHRTAVVDFLTTRTL
jgi:hypothetical protein